MRMSEVPLAAVVFTDAMGAAMLCQGSASLETQVSIFVIEALAAVGGRPCLGAVADILGPERALRLLLICSSSIGAGLAVASLAAGVPLLAKQSSLVLSLRGIHSALRGTLCIAQIIVISGHGHHGARLGRLMSANDVGGAVGATLVGKLTAPLCVCMGSTICLINTALAGILVSDCPRESKDKCEPRKARACHKSVNSDTAGLAFIYLATVLQACGWGSFSAAETAYIEEAYHAGAPAQRNLAIAGTAAGLVLVSCASNAASGFAGDSGILVMGHVCLCALYAAIAARVRWWLVAGIFIAGSASEQAISCTGVKALGALAPPSLRGVCVGLLHAASAAGLLLGPFVGSTAYALDHRMPFAVAAACSLAVLAMLLLPSTGLSVLQSNFGDFAQKSSRCFMP